MTERLAVLLVALLLELLGGLGLGNETMASRGRIEAHRRRAETCAWRQVAVDSLFHEIVAPSNLQRLADREDRHPTTEAIPAL